MKLGLTLLPVAYFIWDRFEVTYLFVKGFFRSKQIMLKDGTMNSFTSYKILTYIFLLTNAQFKHINPRTFWLLQSTIENGELKSNSKDGGHYNPNPNFLAFPLSIVN